VRVVAMLGVAKGRYRVRFDTVPADLAELKEMVKEPRLHQRAQYAVNRLVLDYANNQGIASLEDGMTLLNLMCYGPRNSFRVVRGICALLKPFFVGITASVQTVPYKIKKENRLTALRALTGEKDFPGRDVAVVHFLRRLELSPTANRFAAGMAEVVGVETLVGGVLMLDEMDCRGPIDWHSDAAVAEIMKALRDKIMSAGIDAAVQFANSIRSDPIYPVRKPVAAILRTWLPDDPKLEKIGVGAATKKVDHNADLKWYC
jgi:hypothetical protein